MVPEVLEYIEEYMSKGLEYAKTIEEECDSKINFYFNNSDNFEDYCEKMVTIDPDTDEDYKIWLNS